VSLLDHRGLLIVAAQHLAVPVNEMHACASLAGDPLVIVLGRACAAFSVDMRNPCGAHGYAVRPRISTSLNAATRECYKFGGSECVIRAWACKG
jgi:hypothetical protein